MNRFAQFVLVLVVAGAGMALAIVLVKNQRTGAGHAQAVAAERARIADMFSQLRNDNLQHAYVVVDWQRTGGDGQVVETSLLWQDQTSRVDERGHPVVPPVRRIKIPGDTVYVDGVALEFGRAISLPLGQADFVVGTTVALFDHVYGAGIDEKPTEECLIVPMGGVPLVFRRDGEHASEFDLEFWSAIGKYRRDTVTAKTATAGGITFKPLTAQAIKLQPSTLYDLVVGYPLGVEIHPLADRRDPRILEIRQHAPEGG